MKEHSQDAEAFIGSALIPGTVILPQRLLDALGRLSSPLDFLISDEPESGPFDVFREDYPELHLRRCKARSLSSAEIEQAAGLLRWVLRELSAWTRKNDPRFVKMAAMLVVLNEFAWGEAQWALLSDRAVNPELIKLFSGIVRDYHCEIHTEPGHRASRTNDLVASLVKADSQGDWVAISEFWQQVEPWLYEGWLLGLVVPCLARFDMSVLASAMHDVPQIQTAYLVARSLAEANSLRLARATSSHRYRFAAVLSITWGEHVFTGIGNEAEAELAALLVEVSQAADQWPRWMQAFNKYPIRFPALQRPLGKALAQAPEHALASYVDSISLFAWPFNGMHYGHPSRPDGRQCSAWCLGAFREVASPVQRCRLWQLARARWVHWAFGLQSPSERHLGSVVGSELDYAITAHAAECLTPDERKSELDSLSKGVRDIEMGWYSSWLDLVSRRNALLSAMQPLLAAGSPEWLFKQPMIPPEFVEYPYTREKFGTD